MNFLLVSAILAVFIFVVLPFLSGILAFICAVICMLLPYPGKYGTSYVPGMNGRCVR